MGFNRDKLNQTNLCPVVKHARARKETPGSGSLKQRFLWPKETFSRLKVSFRAQNTCLKPQTLNSKQTQTRLDSKP